LQPLTALRVWFVRSPFFASEFGPPNSSNPFSGISLGIDVVSSPVVLFVTGLEDVEFNITLTARLAPDFPRNAGIAGPPAVEINSTH